MNGVLKERGPLGTIFGYSSTCDPTILTGKMPREHGHFAFYYYNPAGSPFRHYRALRFLPGSLMNRGRVRNKLSQILKRVHGFTGYFQLYNMPFDRLHYFDYSEKRDIFGPGGINGQQSIIFEALAERGIPYVLENDYMSTEQQCVDRFVERFRDGKAVLGYLFLAKLDAILHQYGTQATQPAAHLRWYEEQLARMLGELGKTYDEVRLFVFSDHGMTDIHTVCDLMGRIDGLGLRFGEDYAAVYDSTVARFWFLNDTARERIVAALREEPLGKAMTAEDLRGYGCDFADAKYGELFFLLQPGVLLCPSFMGAKPLAAMHGYAPEHKDSVASFLSNVPVARRPQRLDDLYELMLTEACANAGMN